ncbi:MAG: PDZ domain-containing protein [Simkaniaceae bacterium]|nr:PDZ domain-containing protein [Simkaniaceae bacterium]
MKYLTHLLLTTLFFVFLQPIEAKAPALTPPIVKQKINDFLQAHIVHKELTCDLVKKTMQNYLLELDPSKTYFIEAEIQNWIEPDDTLGLVVKNHIDKNDFSHFKEIYETLIVAIERRSVIESKISSMELPKDVKISEFSDLLWAKTEEELTNRILRIRGLQAEAAERINHESKDLLIKRLEKNRLTSEAELLGINASEREKTVLSFVLKSIASALDSHTAYFTPSEANQFIIQVQQKLYGIGAGLRDDLNGLTVVSLVEGGPADLSKLLKVGDRVIAVNGNPIIGLNISDAVELIRGPEGTLVTLTVMRDYEIEEEETTTKKIDIDILRQEVVLSESRYKTQIEPFGNGVIANIHLFSFYQDATTSSAADLKKQIEDIRKQHNLLGIILDLRSNGGGLLTQAVDVAGLFINRGIVASIKDSVGNVQHLRNFENKKTWDGPLLILTNRASASAAEIVAQSLQDYGRALVIGDDFTYGKGTYQTFTLEANHSGKINPEGEFKVTRGMYFTVSGRSPQFTGLKTNIEIPGPFSQIDFGERFTKNAIQNDSIPANFHDDLSDIHPIHRYRMKSIYAKDLEQQNDSLLHFIPKLQENVEHRISLNPNYVAFLEDMKKDSDDLPRDSTKKYGKNDLQLEESFNVMKDLILLLNAQNFSQSTPSQPKKAA